MCFSADASLITAGVLIPMGAYSVATALRKSLTHIPLATVPTIFGLQQCFEAGVWRGLEHNDEALVENSALAFLFFAIAFWPAWMPFSAAVLEPRPVWRRLFFMIAGVGLIMGSTLYARAASHYDDWLKVSIAGHAIKYSFVHMPERYTAVGETWQVLYFVAVCVPLVLSRDGKVRLLGIAITASAAIAHALFWYAFASVWCFFAAVLSVQICHMMYVLPQRA